MLVWVGHSGRLMAVGPSAVSVHMKHCLKRCLIPCWCQELLLTILHCLLWHVLKDTELLCDAWGHSEEFVHVSVTWCRCVLMDRMFTGPCGCQSQIMPESCLGYMLLFRCFTSVCTGSNFINVCGLCVVV